MRVEELYDYCSRQVVTAPVSLPTASISTHLPGPALVVRVPDPSRPGQLPATPSNPSEAQGTIPEMATIVSALNTALTYLERMSGVEKEIIDKEGWNFDTTVALLDLTKKMGQIPFGGGSSSQFQGQPSAKSSKGKERETFDGHTQRAVTDVAPHDYFGSWLGQSPLQGEFRFISPMKFL